MGSAAFNREVGQLWRQSNEVIYQVYPPTFCDANADGHGDLRGIISKLDYLGSLAIDAVWIPPIYKSPEGPEGDGGYAVEDYREIDPRYGTLEDFRELVHEAKKRGIKIYMDFVMPHTAHTHEWFQKSRDPQNPEHDVYKDYFVWHPGHYHVYGQPIPASDLHKHIQQKKVVIIEPKVFEPDTLIGGFLIDADAARELAAEGKIKLPNEKPLLPNNWKSVFGGDAWEWDEKRSAYYLHHFLKSQPALNLNRMTVKHSIFNEMEVWRRRGVDGFRLDSVPFSNYDPSFQDNTWMRGEYPFHGQGWGDQLFDHSMCQSSTSILIEQLRSRFGYAKLMGEVIAGPYGGGGCIELAAQYQKAGLDCSYTNVDYAVSSGDAEQIRGCIRFLAEKLPNGGLMSTISNHDGSENNPRAWNRITDRVPDPHKLQAYRQVLQLYMCLDGTISFLQGDELGLPHGKLNEHIHPHEIRDPVAQTIGLHAMRDGCRLPMPWKKKVNGGFSEAAKLYLPMPASYTNMAVDVQDQDSDSMLNFMRDLIRWRKQQPALRHAGETNVLSTQGSVVAFVRTVKDQALLCAFNFSNQKVYFRPSDLMDEQTMKRASITRDTIMVLHPYGYNFSGERGLHREYNADLNLVSADMPCAAIEELKPAA